MTECYQIQSGFVPKPKGLKLGARNRNSKDIEKAIIRARAHHVLGMPKIEAARLVSEEMNLPIQADTLARLI